MNKINRTVKIFITTLIGFFYCSNSANSLSYQNNTQEAFISGKNNQITQVNQQTLINTFLFETDWQAEFNKSLETTYISQFIAQESRILGKNNQLYQVSQQTLISSLFLEINLGKELNGLLDFKSTNLSNNKENNQSGFTQSITQKALIFGKNNQVTQISNQILVNSLFLKIDSQVQPDKVNKNQEKSDDFKLIQSITQKAFISGKNNRVNQVSYQTLIKALFLEIDLERKPDHLLCDNIDISLNSLLNCELNYLINSILTPIQTKIPLNTLSTNSKKLSVNVPEPTFTSSLLVLVILGVKSVLLCKKE